jgi:hypothetical protein
MPERKHVRGVGEKEQRQYEHIKEKAKKEPRYRGREKEVAARTVLKRHKGRAQEGRVAWPAAPDGDDRRRCRWVGGQ